MVVWCTQNMRRDDSSVTWHQPCNNQIIIIVMYIYHALINALSAHMTHISLNVIFYTHVEHSPTKTVYIKHYKINIKIRTTNTHAYAHTRARAHTHTHTHTHTALTAAETGY